MFFTKTADDFSRVWTVIWLISAYCCFVLLRAGVKFGLVRWRSQGGLARKIAIIGAGEYGERLLHHLKTHSEQGGFHIVGIFDDRSSRIPKAELDGCPILGDTDKLVEYCRRGEIDQAIIALPWSAETRLVSIMDKIRPVPVDLQLAPERIGYHLSDRQFSDLSGLPMLTVFERPLSGWSYILKSLEDRVLAFFILILISPFLLLFAILVKIDSPGPILYRQRRYGFNNNVISVWKFRTMFHRGTEDAAPETSDGALRQACRIDPRVTRVGRYLRRSSLDELPQFFNVIQGSMSIVGPRPHAVAHNTQFAQSVAEYYARHRVKPGITGWAQVHGYRGETDTAEKLELRVKYDLYYIDNWSLLLDLKIILMTIVVGFVNENAY
ncbi:MAG: undecaprenyl-phosphate glucose phosphotransferase [Rhodospirillaceae bacterium]|jgi:Undecaprenyl-phosphate glucose phosphotransferase|nr:undecaprenyl-phosphate glucose phosphotransferase [Rhodospirillaceae bacterium]MBT4688446.1 undecaprenyl-phosphate glucose phosphotransferase [Rhodospirillaceae bacterium]MBT5079881.1 undecaprenyl-phosphate glucose phosphotransferase [Rhodospirillaceae bacterium]MBT5525903.1 undecaprenyl-phosphate glucose phosphotransferase [Rhodospirillaceae bacterium]MBT5879465.1 undecaprenyl-phosphate glucose phosphotransferase [Rhodospirillaceae bacterium]